MTRTISTSTNAAIKISIFDYPLSTLNSRSSTFHSPLSILDFLWRQNVDSDPNLNPKPKPSKNFKNFKNVASNLHEISTFQPQCCLYLPLPLSLFLFLALPISPYPCSYVSVSHVSISRFTLLSIWDSKIPRFITLHIYLSWMNKSDFILYHIAVFTLWTLRDWDPTTVATSNFHWLFHVLMTLPTTPTPTDVFDKVDWGTWFVDKSESGSWILILDVIKD
jgi:hypothetical protein